MLLRDAGHKRPAHLGAYPLEALATDASIIAIESARAPQVVEAPPASDSTRQTMAAPATLRDAVNHHIALLQAFATGDIAPNQAPVPTDLARRSVELKGAAYYLDADHAGICELPEPIWLRSTKPNVAPDQVPQHTHALVILCAHPRAVEPDNAAFGWVNNAQDSIAQLKCAEIAIALAGHVRALGFNARAHTVLDKGLDMQRAAVLAGIAQRTDVTQPDAISSPFLGTKVELGVVSFDYPVAVDLPLAANAKISALRYWLGVGGAMSGRERNRRARRPSHLSRYPMEQVTRVAQPTTAIFEDEIPRVPLRANFFSRARHGDLGKKAQREVARFASKHPLTHGMMPLINILKDEQDGPVAAIAQAGFTDAAANTKAIKTLAHLLGADLAGCLLYTSDAADE